MIDLSQLLETAKHASKKAGECLIGERTKARQVNISGPKDVKLQGDLLAEAIILDYLQQETGYPALSEEKGTIGTLDAENPMWIVDPLDGSLNYSQEIPLCCVSIALWQKKAPLLGVVYDFNRDELFSGIVGEGAWLNQVPIQVSGRRIKSESVLCTGFPIQTDFSSAGIQNFAKQIQAYKKVRLLGSAALSLAYVACGRVDAYHENNIMLWDVAAGCAIVQAAGGTLELADNFDLLKPIEVLAKGFSA